MRLKPLVQIGIVFFICIVGELTAQLLPFGFPGSVASMLLLFILLVSRVVKVENIKDKTNFLLDNMAFFFVPSSVGIVKYYSEIKPVIISFIFICVITTLFTFLTTAYTVKGVMKIQSRIRTKRGKL